MKGIGMKEINRWAFRRVGWVGKATLFCSGILALLALVVVMSVLTAVMLMAIALPATAQQRTPREPFVAPRKDRSITNGNHN
jgi:hypothetical protein